MSAPSKVSIRCFDAGDTEQVIALWRDAFPEYRDTTRPQRDPRLSIANKLATQPELFFVAVDGVRVVGTVMAGYDGHRGWMYSLAVFLASSDMPCNTDAATDANYRCSCPSSCPARDTPYPVPPSTR